jgi:hypothetical protein
MMSNFLKGHLTEESGTVVCFLVSTPDPSPFICTSFLTPYVALHVFRNEAQKYTILKYMEIIACNCKYFYFELLMAKIMLPILGDFIENC